MTTDVDSSAAMLRVGRDLADALRAYARERRDEDRKYVLALQTELCALRRAELAPVMEQPLIQEGAPCSTS